MNYKKLLYFIVFLILCFNFQAAYPYYELKKDESSYTLKAVRDLDYKKAIIKAAGDKSYTVENLSSLIGPEELADFIKENSKNSEIYSPKEENIKNGIYRANFHIHTVNSDGSMTVEEVLEQAQNYAKNLPNGQYMYIAITDHNTVLGVQELIRVLQKNPGKYSRLKIVSGIEIYTQYKNDVGAKDRIDIHVLAWCINPFDKALMIQFEKKNLNDKWNWQERDFDSLISFMKDYGIVGVAHPARYTLELGNDKYAYIVNMLSRYVKAGKSDKPLFVEGYYQSYPDLGEDHNKYIDFINQEAIKKNIFLTGSTDAHGKNIFYMQYNKKEK